MGSTLHWVPVLPATSFSFTLFSVIVLGYIRHPCMKYTIRNLLRFFFRSPVPNSERNTKFHVQGRARSERKRLILDSEYLVACTPHVFMPKDACAYSLFVHCGRVISSAHLGYWKYQWTRSMIGTVEGSSLSLYPSIPRTLSPDDRVTDSTSKKVKIPQRIPKIS